MKKSSGNMYPWVTHTHAHLGGECPHKCSYCYVDNPRFGRPKNFCGELRFIPESLNVKFGSGKTIFIDHMNDLWASEVDACFILAVMKHCREWNDNNYVFQTKNPARYESFLPMLPAHHVLGCTIETNREISKEVSLAPHPQNRANAMWYIGGTHVKFVTIEPVMDFDVSAFLLMLEKINPDFVNIGADSKDHGLPEPSPEKVRALIAGLGELEIEIREKHNLERLLK